MTHNNLSLVFLSSLFIPIFATHPAHAQVVDYFHTFASGGLTEGGPLASENGNVSASVAFDTTMAAEGTPNYGNGSASATIDQNTGKVHLTANVSRNSEPFYGTDLYADASAEWTDVFTFSFLTDSLVDANAAFEFRITGSASDRASFDMQFGETGTLNFSRATGFQPGGPATQSYQAYDSLGQPLSFQDVIDGYGNIPKLVFDHGGSVGLNILKPFGGLSLIRTMGVDFTAHVSVSTNGNGSESADFGNTLALHSIAVRDLHGNLLSGIGYSTESGASYSVLNIVPGDFNHDGIVDAEDLVTWTSGYGLSGDARSDQGDANADGDVDGNDFLVWQREVGNPYGAAASAIPEPSSTLLAAVALLAMGMRRR